MNATLPSPSTRSTTPSDAPLAAGWRPASVGLIVLSWLILHVGCLFLPGLLDDVDSIYIEIARQMLVRHDFVTPYIDSVRFFDKPPLMFWLAAGSMHLFGATDWAARLPLALLTLALLLATYALGLRLFAAISPAHAPDRGALYAALALGTSIGPFLYTRFFIPDIIVTLWLTLSVHLFLIAADRARTQASPLSDGADCGGNGTRFLYAGVPSLAFAATLAASLLTKGFIGLVFPLGFALLYLALTRQLPLLKHLHLFAATTLFLALALPWHILAALRNPAVPLPRGVGLPATGGWAWFYLYNEHIARFLSRRIPHDYGQVPIPLFLALAGVWLIPWVAFLPGAIASRLRDLRAEACAVRCHQSAIALPLWIVLVLGFFTLSARQEYYSLPALPAFALLIGGLLARADRNQTTEDYLARQSAVAWSRWFLVPLTTLLAAACIVFAVTARSARPGTDLASLLAHTTDSYNLSLSHLFDLTPTAMGLFRPPLALCALAMLVIGPVCFALRRSSRTFAANVTLAGASTALLLSVHAGLTRFYPTLGSKLLAQSILLDQHAHPAPSALAPDLLLIDGELTAGSSLLFYTHQTVHLINGRINGPWYGSFWPDAPPIFETDDTLHRLWASPRRLYLLTYRADARSADLARFGFTRTLQSSGGKAILTNRP